MDTPDQLKKPTKALVRLDHQTLRSLLLEILLSRTQTEASAAIGITQPTLHHWLAGTPRHRPSLRKLRIVAQRLHVDVEYLLRLTGRGTK